MRALWWVMALTACDTPDSCPPGSVFSPHFGQCVGVEEDDDPPPDPTSTAETGDTGDTT